MSHPPLPSSYEGLLLEARGLRETGQTVEAIARYEYLLARLARLNDKIMERRPALQDLRKQAIADVIPLLRWERRLTEAVEHQRELLALDPERAALWRRELASLRVERGEVDAGLAELRALAEEEAADPWGWLVLGHEARLEGRLAESQAALDRALEAGRGSPDNSDALATTHYERFMLFKEMRRWDDAVSAWEQAVTLEPKALAGTVEQVYKMLTDAGLYGTARPFVDRDPNPVRAGLQRGLLDTMTGKAFDAMQAWRQAAEHDPAQHEGGEEAWLEAALRVGRADEVTRRAAELTARYPSARSFALVGIAWAALGNVEAARALLEQAVLAQRRLRPVKQKLDGADWRLLNSLVQDNNVKSALKPFFAVIETTWSQSMP